MTSQQFAALTSTVLALIWGIGALRLAKTKPSSVMGWRGEVNWLAVLSCQWLLCAVTALGSSDEELKVLSDVALSSFFVIPMIVYMGLLLWWRITGSTKPEGTGETQDVD